MGVVWRFKSHEDFEESCYKHGIYWVPPHIKTFSLKNKQKWQRKVLCGKIKVFRHLDKDFMKRYHEAMSEVTRINGKVDLDSLPEEFHSYYLERQKRKQYYRRFRRSIKDKDRKIYLHKWYPWSYNRNGQPSLVLQGFYSIKIARKRFVTYYGKEACKSIHWIKGKGALEREFLIGRTLRIGGRYKPPISKILLTENFNNHISRAKDILGKEISKKKGLKSKAKEGYLLKLVGQLNYGTKEYRTATKLIPEKQIQLSKAKSIKAKRKKTLYEEP